MATYLKKSPVRLVLCAEQKSGADEIRAEEKTAKDLLTRKQGLAHTNVFLC
jgi:hypothetical protein